MFAVRKRMVSHSSRPWSVMEGFLLPASLEQTLRAEFSCKVLGVAISMHSGIGKDPLGNTPFPGAEI